MRLRKFRPERDRFEQCDQLPDSLIAQLVEYCTGITEAMGSNPVQALNLQQLLAVCETAMINHKFIYFFLKHLSGPESQILESDWLIPRAPAVRIFPSGPHVRTAPGFPGLRLF